jgi:SNF2 family DNA or RNA helicase
VRIDGSVTELRRKAAVDAFQQDPAVRAALLSITAAGIGLTLTAATVVVFVELWWTPAALIQAEDRAHRLGQRDALEVHYLTALDTADDLIWRMVQEKLGIIGSVVGNGGAGGGSSGDGASGSRPPPVGNVFRDIRYSKLYEDVQQRLAEEASRQTKQQTSGRATRAPPAAAAADEGPCISDASTELNPGANYAEVFEQQRQQEEGDEEVEQSMESQSQEERSSDDEDEDEDQDEEESEVSVVDEDEEEEVEISDSEEDMSEEDDEIVVQRSYNTRATQGASGSGRTTRARAVRRRT